MRILVTGCAGFIGFHLIKRLLSEGNFVVGIDNFDNYYSVGLKKKRIGELKKLGLVFIKGDILDRDDLKKCFEKKVEIVIHLAAKVGVRHSWENPEEYLRVNVMGTQNLWNFVIRYNIKRFIFASSSSVYGSQQKKPFYEDDVGLGQMMSPYAVSKRAGELVCQVFATNYGIKTTVLRFFTVYGPMGRPDMAIPRIVDSLIRDSKFIVYGDIKSARDFTYVGDVVGAVIQVLNYKSKYDVFNIGGGEAIALEKVIQIAEKITKKKLKYTVENRREGDVRATQSSINKSNQLLHWSPRVKIYDGLSKTIEWSLND